MVTRERLLAITLALIMVTAAGCAGWGTDGPATTGDQQENDTEDLNDAANDAENESTDASANSSGNQSNATASDGDSDSTSESDQSSSDAESDAQSEPKKSGEGDDASDQDSTDREQDGDTDAHDDTSDTGDGSDSTDDTSTPDGDTKSDEKDQQDQKSDDGDQKSDGEKGQKDKKDKPETYTLTVTVLSPDDEPVEGMDVELATHPEGEDVATKTTDENGQVTFEVEPYGYSLHPVIADSEEYTFYGNFLVGVEEDTEFTINLATPPGDDDDKETNTNTLTVNLANDQVDGVEVEVWRAVSGDEDPKKVTKESKNGQVTFEVEPGHYYVDAEGYVGTLSEIDVTDGDTEIRLQNESGATVPIKVTDVETGEPIEGAEISGQCDLLYSGGDEQITGTTGADGVAQAEAGVTPTHCGVEISADGYEDGFVDINVPVDQTVTVELTPAEGNGNGDGSEEQHTLTVNAFDHEGNPLPNASVSVVTDDGGQDVASGTTNENGVATFDVVDGDYVVSVSHDDYEADGTGDPVNVRGEDTSVDVTMPAPNGDTGNSDETHQLTVNALDHEGNPLPNASVSVVTYDGGADVGSATTDENGQVTFELENGDYELGVSAPEQDLYQPSDQRLVSINGADEEFTIELQYSGNEPPDTATGIVRVVNDDGEPIEGERVTITPPDAERESEKYQRVTDENGEVVIEREAKALDDFATYGVSVRGEEKELTIKPDSRHGVQEVEFNPTHRFYLFELVLQVVDENGEPIEGATVETRHGLFPDEWTVAGETNQYGEILLTGGSSEPSDVDAREVRVRGQTLRTSIDYERKVETMQIDTDATSDAANETSESSMNETASANATAALAIA